MRITVGHVLIAAAVIGVAAVKGPDVDFGKAKETARSVKDEIASLVGLFRSGDRSREDTGEAIETAAPVQASVPSAPPAPPPPEPKVEPAPPAPAKAAPAKKTVRPKKRRVRRKTTAAVPAKPPAPKAAAAPKDSLVGQFVVIELTSGREVRGILEEKTAEHYKVQLPGMGPFLYAADTVKSVKRVD